MNTIDDNKIGGQLHPIKDNKELSCAIIGRKNCILYTAGTFQISDRNLFELKLRNIKLVGLAFAIMKYKAKNKTQKEKTNIIVDELSNIDISIGIDLGNNLDQQSNYNKFINGKW